MELEKLEKIKIGKNYFYKDNEKKVFYSKSKNLNEITLIEILTQYKKIEFKFI